nr:hypothetical protein [Zhihengliuella halotolerans]
MPVVLREHEPRVLPQVAPLAALGVLLDLPAHEDVGGRCVEFDVSEALRCLGAVLVDDAAFCLHAGVPDPDPRLDEVDVRPPQSADLAAAQAGARDELEQQAQAVLRCLVAERLEVLHVPHVDGLLRHGWQFDALGHVRAHEAVVHGRVERDLEHGDDAPDGDGAAAGVHEVADERFHVIAAHFRETRATQQGRRDVEFDIPPVVRQRGRLEPVAGPLTVGEPFGEVLGHGLLVRPRVGALVDLDGDLVAGDPRFSLGGEPGLAVLDALLCAGVFASVDVVAPGAVFRVREHVGAGPLSLRLCGAVREGLVLLAVRAPAAAPPEQVTRHRRCPSLWRANL